MRVFIAGGHSLAALVSIHLSWCRERSAFDGKLPATLEIVWSARLLTTAGRSINSW